MKTTTRSMLSVVVLLVICATVSVHAHAGPSATFCVFSDPHYFDPDLGTDGAAFQTYIMQDRKMIAESEAILSAAIDSVLRESPDFLIVAGDLTKDGEKSSHEKFAAFMRTLEQNGINVYVVPGNHDVLNTHAFGYTGDNATRVENVTPAEFAEIYDEFGYGEAIAQDATTLSYIVEPVPGLWFFCLDPCMYDKNTEDTVMTGGAFTQDTLTWIVERLEDARNQGKTVLGMMHHGLMEHYAGQKQFFSDYVIDDFESVTELFGTNGLNYIFTGHYHAQDSVMRKAGDAIPVFDIETGSLVTAPCPYRVVKLSSDDIMTIRSKHVTSIDYDTGGIPFREYARTFLQTGMNGIVMYQLTAPVEYGGYGVPQDQAAQLTPSLVDAFLAHYTGDEIPDAAILTTIDALMKSDDANAVLIGRMLGSLWTDPSPADNTMIIDMTGGVGVAEPDDSLPAAFWLGKNHPNPFNPATTIEFSIAREGLVTINVFNALGQKIETLVDAHQSPGNYSVVFDGSSLTSGIYYYTMDYEGSTASGKMILVK